MDNNNIWESISSKIAGEASKNDNKAVKEWLREDEANEKVYKGLRQIWKHNHTHLFDGTNIYRKYLHRKNQFGKKKSVTPFVYYALRISAVMFLLVGSIFVVNQIRLNNAKIAFQEISVPKGSRSAFNLPDGTKVWLSNNSTIKYPTKFVGKTRELEITGEAYFDVRHNKRKPFIVNFGTNRIRVLGTQFSVTAFPEDNRVKAELVEGKIQFEIGDGNGNYKSYGVKPSFGLELDKSTGKLYETKVPDGFYDYWLNGIYEFRNETLEELALKIDRIYNTQIIFEAEALKTKRFSGTISIDDNIFTFIEAVKSTSVEPITYRYKENKLFINLKD